MEKQLVIFELANEFYGVDIAAVESIIKLQPITVVPHAPSFVKGVTNLRGKVMPVIELHKRFGLPSVEPTKDSRIVVVAVAGMEAGLIVDGVSEVLTIQDQNVEPAPHMTTTVDSGFITGIAMLDQRLIILLDLSKIMSVQEQEKLEMAAVPA
ncbi:MAG: chemotaxis protein CheW [Anaerolineaceae bacterium]|nr:chemotaxis protein CheW [Anaerolineaceae bacterium]